MTDTKLLEDKIRESGYKRYSIAERMGISAYALAMKIDNEREFKASEIDALCKLLNIDIEERMRIFFAAKVDFKSTR